MDYSIGGTPTNSEHLGGRGVRTTSIVKGLSASGWPELDREQEILTLPKIRIVPENYEIDFLKKNSDVKRNWDKLLFSNGLKPYLVTASPTNCTYDASFSSKGGLAEVMKFLSKYWGIKQAFGTTEKLGTEKVHHHIIVWDTDLRARFDKYPNKSKDGSTLIIGRKHRWGLHIQPIDRLTSAYEYITKECKLRDFIKLQDYRSLMTWTEEEKANIILSRKKPVRIVST